MELQNRTVVITGAKGGLGTFVTKAFLDAGARVIGVSRSIASEDFPHERFSAISAELANGDDARRLIEEVLAKAGRIDALVHLIGGFAGGKLLTETDDATVDRMLDLNFRSAFQLMRAALPHMRERGSGRIIAVGSRAAVEPAPMAGVYAASKAALVSLICTVARENADRGITANVVLPATMDTPANRAADPKADFSKWVSPCQVARLFIYLASDASLNINGAAIPVYGKEA